MKNGYTLIELLIVIAILSVLSVVITFGITGMIKNTDDESCNSFKKEIEDAACVYVKLYKNDDSNVRSVSLSELINNGLITSEKDGCTNEAIDTTKTVSITWSNGEKTCTYE